MNIIKQIKTICNKCLNLKLKYIIEDNFEIDWVCIFSQSDKQYTALISQAQEIAEQIESVDNGVVFKLNYGISTPFGMPKVLKIRKYDITRPELGDVDLKTNYYLFKKKYITKNNFKLIERASFEMLELTDPDFDVRVYFSSIPPSKLRGIK